MIERPMLVIVDTSFDFMRKEGKLNVPNAQEIEGNLGLLTDYAAASNHLITFFQDWHDENSREISATPDFVTTYPDHCRKNTPGAEFVPATTPRNPYVVDWNAPGLNERKMLDHLAYQGNLIIRKDAFDAFKGNPYTTRIVDLLGPRRIYVTGVATNVCVDQFVSGVANRDGLELYVVQDAIKELPDHMAKVPASEILRQWQQKGVKLITTQDVLKGAYGLR